MIIGRLKKLSGRNNPRSVVEATETEIYKISKMKAILMPRLTLEDLFIASIVIMIYSKRTLLYINSGCFLLKITFLRRMA